MLVVDASAVADLLLATPRSAALADHLGDHPLIAPDLLNIELISVMRRLDISGKLYPGEADQVLREYRYLGVDTETRSVDVWESVWHWRHRVSAYDAHYLGVAELYSCQVLTLDRRLISAAPDLTVTV